MKDSIVRICVTLLDVDPAIWRRIEVPANFTLEGLHDVLQTIMGWANYHLHHFQLGDLTYGEPTPEDRDMLDGRKLKLSALAIDGAGNISAQSGQSCATTMDVVPAAPSNLAASTVSATHWWV